MSSIEPSDLAVAETPKFHGDPIEENTLYVVLYERKAFGEPYHWALLLTSPASPPTGEIHQATDRSGAWVYDIETLAAIEPARGTLCLVGFGPIAPEKREAAEAAMRSVNVPPAGGMLRTGEVFNCRTWLKMAVAAMQRTGALGLGLHVEQVETMLRVRAGQLVGGKGEVPVVKRRIV